MDGPAELLRADAHILRLVLDQLAFEHIHRADEIRDEFRTWKFVDLRRRAGLNDFAVVHDADAARQSHGLLLIVGHDHEGHAELILQADQLELRVLAQFLVERAQGLVEQQQLGPLDQRTRQRHALTLAARQLVRLALGEIAQFHQVEHGGHALLNFELGHAVLFQPKATFCSTFMCGNSAYDWNIMFTGRS
jgi:hypothetical protein